MVTPPVPLEGARLFHANVNCGDLSRSRDFYVDALGLTAGAHTATDEPQDGAAFGLAKARWDAWILLGSRGYDGGAVDLLEWQEPRPAGAPPGAVNECGFQRLGFHVPDLDAAISRIRERGGAAWSAPVEHDADGHAIRIVMANDPDGTMVEVVEGDGVGLLFVSVVCADLERSLGFYSSLGFREATRFAIAHDDATHVRVAGRLEMDEVVLTAPGGGDVVVILVGFRRPVPVAGRARPANTVGIWRTAFVLPDLDAACAGLARLGITTLSPPVEMAMGPGLPNLRFVCFAGPDGEILELIEQPAAGS